MNQLCRFFLPTSFNTSQDKVIAIKALRDLTGLGLVESKRVIEGYSGYTTQLWAQEEGWHADTQRAVSTLRSVGVNVEYIPDEEDTNLAQPAPTTLGDLLRRKLAETEAREPAESVNRVTCSDLLKHAAVVAIEEGNIHQAIRILQLL